MTLKLHNLSGSFDYSGVITNVNVSASQEDGTYFNIKLDDEDTKQIGTIVQASLRNRARKLSESFKESLDAVICTDLLLEQ